VKKCFMFFAVLISVLIQTDLTHASVNSSANINPEVATHEDFHDPDYYNVKYDPRVAIIDLMNFEHVSQPLPYPVTAYDRKLHFRGWIDYPGDNLCLNTRAKVLLRDSHATVTYTANGCGIQAGHWDDPYTGKAFELSKDIQIDHFVPLKNVYMTGGFEWDQNKRCLYANFIGNNFHLLSVSGFENMSKGDGSPAEYMPPNKAFTCQYLKNWLSVKVIWSLRLTPMETAAVQRNFDEAHCDRAEFKMTSADLTAQRQFMDDNKDLCQRVP
jgi:hypothetical protein